MLHDACVVTHAEDRKEESSAANVRNESDREQHSDADARNEDEKHSVAEARKRRRNDEENTGNKEDQSNMGIAEEAMEVLGRRNRKKLKAAMTSLRNSKEQIEEKARIVALFSQWIDELKGDNDEFGAVLRMSIVIGHTKRVMIPLSAQRVSFYSARQIVLM